MYSMTKEIDGNSARYNNNKVVYSNIPPVLLSRMFNDGLSFIPYRPLNKLAEHFTLAEIKYPNAEAGNGHTFPNWAKGQLFESFVIDSMYRHLMAYNSGEVNDPDFGTHHLISVAWGAAVLYHFFSHYDLYKEFDDRKWVGFTNFGSRSESIMDYLTYVQTSDNIEGILTQLYSLFFSVLMLSEKDFDNSEPISYKVDAERLEKIRNTDYGQKKTASGKSS